LTIGKRLATVKLMPIVKRKHGEWLSVIEAARALGISREAVYKAIEEGRLKARLKVVSRKVWRVDPDSVKSFEVSTVHKKMGEARRRPARKRKPAVDT